MTTTLQFVNQVAIEAGELLIEHFRSRSFDTRLKGDNTAVTTADLAADRLISKAIKQYYPDDMILSEEHKTTIPLEGMETPTATWIIDPLDGTTNFSLGLPIWGVLITRVMSGFPESTVQYFPLINEIYSAQIGQGATLNGKPIQVVEPENESRLSFFACCSRTHRRYKISVPYKLRVLGSAAYTYCAIARGMAILGFEATPKIWDIAGAWLLVQEAGGVIESFSGDQPFPLRGDINFAEQIYPTIAAARRNIADRAFNQIVAD